MYHDESWINGFYIDNHKKYRCMDCEKEFIVGEKLLEDCLSNFPVCPYCGNIHVECTAWTEDKDLPELASDMGCLAIYIDQDTQIACTQRKSQEEVRKLIRRIQHKVNKNFMQNALRVELQTEGITVEERKILHGQFMKAMRKIQYRRKKNGIEPLPYRFEIKN